MYLVSVRIAIIVCLAGVYVELHLTSFCQVVDRAAHWTGSSPSKSVSFVAKDLADCLHFELTVTHTFNVGMNITSEGMITHEDYRYHESVDCQKDPIKQKTEMVSEHLNPGGISTLSNAKHTSSVTACAWYGRRWPEFPPSVIYEPCTLQKTGVPVKTTFARASMDLCHSQVRQTNRWTIKELITHPGPISPSSTPLVTASAERIGRELDNVVSSEFICE